MVPRAGSVGSSHDGLWLWPTFCGGNSAAIELGLGTILKGNIATACKLLDDLVTDPMQCLGLTNGEGDVLTVTLIARKGARQPQQMSPIGSR